MKQDNIDEIIIIKYRKTKEPFNFIVYILSAIDQILKFFGVDLKNNNVYCRHCKTSFLFDKEKISSTHLDKSQKRVFMLKCPNCYYNCYKWENTLSEQTSIYSED